MCIFSKDLFFSIVSTKPANLLAEITILPDPSDAIVTLNAEGYVQSGNSIKVPIGTIVSWKVEKDKYQTRESSFAVTGNANVPVKLSEQPLRTLSINTTPADAAVVITGDGYTNAQGTKAISVPAGTTVTYTVSDPLGQLSLTESDTVVVQEDNTINVVMRTKINVTKVLPPDAEVRINGEILTYKEQTCNQTAVVDVTRDGYDRFYQTFSLNERGIVPDFVQEIELKETSHSLVVEASPFMAKLVVAIGEETHTGQGRVTISNVYPRTEFTVTASLDGYDTKTETFTMPSSDYGVVVSLVETEYMATITSTPSEANIIVAINGEEKASGTGSVSVKTKAGVVIDYSVSYLDKEEAGNFTMPAANYSKAVVLDAEDEYVTLITETTTKYLTSGRYKCIGISGGGKGGQGTSLAYSRGKVAYGGGGGGSGKVFIGEFISKGEDITFTVGAGGTVINLDNSVFAGTTSISGSKSGVMLSVGGGGSGGIGPTSSGGNSTSIIYNYVAVGGDGGSGGGGGGKTAAEGTTTAGAGGAGGIGGYNGVAGGNGKSGGKGIKNTSGSNAGNGAAAGSTMGQGGKGGKGAVSIQSSLLTVSGFDSATVDSIYNAMAGGSGGSGQTGSATYSSAGGGGGGGAWTAGGDAHTAAYGSKCLTTGGDGGNGAILYRRIAWS